MKAVSLATGMLLPLACARVANAFRMKPMPTPMPLTKRDPAPGDSSHQGQGTFQQLIDHANPGLGTFPQRYWWSSDNYGGPGSPVVLYTPGETDASNFTGYAYPGALPGLMGQAIRGAIVIMEHRYFGTSSPVKVLSTANMKHLTLDNAIKDHAYFARNVRLPFDLKRTSTPDKAPWVLTGGSYGGALSAWTSRLDPGTFWAYHASSATVESISKFWHFLDPIRDGAMPKNCSADVIKVVGHVDQVLGSGTDTEKKALKDKFGLGTLASDDFASVLAMPVFSWQDMDPSGSVEWPSFNFIDFCDHVENASKGSGHALPDAKGVGLEKALDGYAKWSNDFLVKKNWCHDYYKYQAFASNNLACFDSHNAKNPIFSDTSLTNTWDRAWLWMGCNEAFEGWIVAPPAGTPSILSRLLDVKYWTRQCALAFPPGPEGETYGLATGRSAATVNAFTGGWDGYWAKSKRLIMTNGELDPWKAATVSSDQRPGGPLRSTAQTPVNIIKGGNHCSDMDTDKGASPDLDRIVDHEVAVIKGWVDEYYKTKTNTRRQSSRARVAA